MNKHRRHLKTLGKQERYRQITGANNRNKESQAADVNYYDDDSPDSAIQKR